MIADHRLMLVLLHEDGRRLKQTPIEPDFDPAIEWTRFEALRNGYRDAAVLSAVVSTELLWDRKAGEPYLRGFSVSLMAEAATPTSEFGLPFFRAEAEAAAAALLKSGELSSDDSYSYSVVAFPSQGVEKAAGDAERPAFELSTEPVPVPSIEDRSLSAYCERAGDGTGAESDDFPVFISGLVLEEAVEQTRRERGRETGGVLLGRLHRDSESSELFAEVTAQIPARHTKSDSVSLTFTSDTWSDVRAALEIRGKEELMLGWYHSHPVREWCRECPLERQRSCGLASDFISAHDRLLHRAMFPSGYSLALILNDVSFSDVTTSLFGWRRGLLVSRGFHRLDVAGVARTAIAARPTIPVLPTTPARPTIPTPPTT